MNFNHMIDHTILKADATETDVIRLCAEAKEYGFASVCVNSSFVPLVHKQLLGSGVKTCCVVGFPLGAMSTAAKAFESKQARADGAQEIDMVIHLGALKDGRDSYVFDDIKAVVDAADGALVKVIIETCLLTDIQKVRACELAVRAGAQFCQDFDRLWSGRAAADTRCCPDAQNGRPDIGVKASGRYPYTTGRAPT